MDNKKTPITPRKRALADPTPFRHQQGRLLLNLITQERVCFLMGASEDREHWQSHHRSTFSAGETSPTQPVCASSIFGKIDSQSLDFMISPENDGFLVDHRMLVPDGQGRATSYRLAGTEAVDLASTVDLESPPARSEHLEGRSEHLPLINPMEDPILLRIADPVRSNKQCSPETTRETIRNLCCGKFFTLNQLASILNRSPDGIRQRFIKPMVDVEKILERRYPQQPNHEQQAYRTREP
ncbi:MAG: hypothetical protein ACOYM3_25135 [Terrimicrobiaceae bacterium]